MNKKVVLLSAVTITVLGIYLFISKNSKSSIFSQHNQDKNIKQKIYVALEEEGRIAVLDASSQKVLKKIDLTQNGVHYMAHNVQVSPNGKSVWVTANVEGKHDKQSFRVIPKVYAQMEMHEETSAMDEAIIIDPLKDEITRRIPLASESHLAHVVLTPDNSYAYVTAQMGDAIYKINTTSYSVVKTIETPKGGQPHGLRITPNGSQAYIAMLNGKALGIVKLSDDTFFQVPLPGGAVQTGVTPDGTYAMASVYDTKQLALYEIKSQKISYVNLPADAKGPIQMYPTPDSKYVYLVDQGYYFNQPENNKVYKIDVEKKEVVKTIEVGQAPHGIVVSRDGKRVYVTNLLSNDVSVIDTEKDIEIGKIPVGEQPNGISVWSKEAEGGDI